jgi:hypothetical protein
MLETSQKRTAKGSSPMTNQDRSASVSITCRENNRTTNPPLLTTTREQQSDAFQYWGRASDKYCGGEELEGQQHH